MDYSYININSGIKFIVFFLLIYYITNNIINNIKNFETYNAVLIICVFSVVLYYILDQYFPSCNL